ncbi:MAG: hypothetical protein ACI9GM_000270 [Salibacteraceae bacterium]|jgi:uncharacterized protein YdiU (UPF0061 family)
MHLHIKDTFSQKLPADPDTSNNPRQVHNACFSYVNPQVPENPKLLHAANEVAELLGITAEDLVSEDFLGLVTGASIVDGTRPYAMCYGGHQFGNWAGQLGDGRAINLTELEHNNTRWAIQLKGSGLTPYSRTADGLAVLRSSIREHLCSEAMHYLGVPTTRSLSISLSGSEVMRDVLYNGNAAMEKGAIVARVAPSFIRFGNFEILASRGEFETLKKLTNFTIQEHFPSIPVGTKKGYLSFLQEVADRTLKMIIDWQRVGFVHGVMNTDNLSILGLTIDYGPYGWLEGYDPNWTPNTTDKQFRRYRFGNQGKIAHWNLYQLANALYSFIDESEPLEAVLEKFNTDYQSQYLEMMRSKLGLLMKLDTDRELVSELEKTLQLSETDMTIFFRNLSSVSVTEKDSMESLQVVQEAFYVPNEITGEVLNNWINWISQYQKRLELEDLSDADRKMNMNAVNPKYVLRNYMAQLVIDATEKGDLNLLQEIYALLKDPYSEQIEYEKWFAKRPEWARNKVGCSMLSCSS